jgi:hypothetical protein
MGVKADVEITGGLSNLFWIGIGHQLKIPGRLPPRSSKSPLPHGTPLLMTSEPTDSQESSEGFYSIPYAYSSVASTKSHVPACSFRLSLRSNRLLACRDWTICIWWARKTLWPSHAVNECRSACIHHKCARLSQHPLHQNIERPLIHIAVPYQVQPFDDERFILSKRLVDRVCVHSMQFPIL